MADVPRIRIGRLDSRERARAEAERLYRRAHRAAGPTPAPQDAVALAQVLEVIERLGREERAA